MLVRALAEGVSKFGGPKFQATGIPTSPEKKEDEVGTRWEQDCDRALRNLSQRRHNTTCRGDLTPNDL